MNKTVTTIGTGNTATIAKPAPVVARTRKGGKFVKTSKAAYIRAYIAAGYTAVEIVAELAKKKIAVRYSQVHRYFQATTEEVVIA